LVKSDKLRTNKKDITNEKVNKECKITKDSSHGVSKIEGRSTETVTYSGINICSTFERSID
jgi:phenylacetate-coenzyme A ligase PaaK-like adenylate-forming protein